MAARTARTAILAVTALGVLLAAGCRAAPGPGAIPALGRLSGVETLPVRLGEETRPALAAARQGSCRIDVRLAPGTLVLAFGWRGFQGPEGATVRAVFRGRDGALHPLVAARLPPGGPAGAEGGPAEGWWEARVPVPEELAGSAGALVFESRFESRGAARVGALYTALPSAIPERAERPNLILVSFDTLRADRLGCYGHRRPTSPAIDAMARQGTRFGNAFAAASWTLPSHFSMMTSLYPGAHGVDPDRRLFAGIEGASKSVRIRGSARLDTLAERLAALGYYTAAITEGGWVDAKFGFDQGFASYVGHGGDDLERGTEAKALGWLAAHRELPFFLFLHTYQVHQPYRQPPPYDRMFVAPGHLGYALPGVALPMAVLDKFKDGSFPPTAGDVEAFRGLYDGEVRHVDAFLGELLAAVERLGLERDTILLLTSDHGEELFEHGGFDHGETLYEEVLRVPMILWGPGRIPAGRTVDAPVSLLDVLPTLVDLAGGTAAGPRQGQSLVPLLAGRGQGLAGRVLFAEGFTTVLHHRLDTDRSIPLAAAREGASQLILHGPDPGAAELFDLGRDPAEASNLAAAHPARVARLRRRILAWQQENARIRASLGAVREELDPETAKRLRALGYL